MTNPEPHQSSHNVCEICLVNSFENAISHTTIVARLNEIEIALARENRLDTRVLIQRQSGNHQRSAAYWLYVIHEEREGSVSSKLVDNEVKSAIIYQNRNSSGSVSTNFQMQMALKCINKNIRR